jgi:hypothetical protein
VVVENAQYSQALFLPSCVVIVGFMVTGPGPSASGKTRIPYKKMELPNVPFQLPVFRSGDKKTAERQGQIVGFILLIKIQFL